MLDDDNVSGAATAQVTVSGSEETALNVAIGGSLHGKEGDRATLSADITDSDSASDKYTYAWSITDADGNPVSLARSNQQHVSFRLGEHGPWTVTVTATDDDNVIGSATEKYTIDGVAPQDVNVLVTNAGYPRAPLAFGQDVSLQGVFNDADDDGASSSSGGSPDETYRYAWTVTDANGNPVAQSDENATAAFSFTPPNPGLYHVMFTVTDDDGLSGYKSLDVNVVPTVSITSTGPYKINELIQNDTTHITVTRSGSLASATSDLIVNYRVLESSTAKPGDDYYALSGTVTIPAGSLSATIDVRVKQEEDQEEQGEPQFDKTVDIQLLDYTTADGAGSSFGLVGASMPAYVLGAAAAAAVEDRPPMRMTLDVINMDAVGNRSHPG